MNKLSIGPSPLRNRILTNGFYYEPLFYQDGKLYEKSRIWFFYEDGTVFHLWVDNIEKIGIDSIFKHASQQINSMPNAELKQELHHWGVVKIDNNSAFVLQGWAAGSGRPIITKGGTIHTDSNITFDWSQGGHINKEKTFSATKLTFYTYRDRPHKADLTPYIRD